MYYAVKSGHVPSVAEYNLWALWGCVDSSHIAKWKYKAEGELPLYGGEIIGHRKIKNLPQKSWSNHLCPYARVCLLPQLLFFCIFSKIKFPSKYRNQSLICSFYLFMHRNRKQRWKCFNMSWEFYFNIQTFFMSTNSVMTFLILNQ